MQYKPEDSVKIAIENLSIGMFVTAIENSKRVNLANAGRVSTSQAIERLTQNGVKYVWVDRKLSSSKCVFRIVPSEPDTLQQAKPESTVIERVKPKPKRLGRSANQKKAKRIIAEAKGLAQKLMSQTFESKVIELDEIEAWADDMIETVLVDSDALSCVAALRQKDSYLLEHSVNVACLLVTFGKHLNLPQQTLKDLAVGGIIHDVGKVKVNDKVLNKPSRLTPEEFEHMKLHQVFAKDMIVNVKGLSDVSRDVCLMHHEKLDGTGYPLGLSADQLPIHGRMSSIVDIYDALTADRCYKAGMSSAEAFKIILSLTPKSLDQDLVYKFINCIGMFPVGSLVELSDGRVAIVWTSNPDRPLSPEVKCIYSNKYHRFVDVSFVDLNQSSLSIAKAVAPSTLKFDPAPFYD